MVIINTNGDILLTLAFFFFQNNYGCNVLGYSIVLQRMLQFVVV